MSPNSLAVDEMLELAPRTRIALGIGLLALGATVAGLGLLGLVEVAVVVALPLAILLVAGGTILVGTSDGGPGSRPV